MDDDPVRLLDDYAPGDFFLATAERTVAGSGVATELTGTDEIELSERVRTVLEDSGARAAVGVLPFDSGSGTPGRLVLPDTTTFAGPAHPAAAALRPRPISPPTSVTSTPAPGDHRVAVAAAVDALRRRDLRKVVLARALDLGFDADIDVRAMLANLVRDNPRGYTFAAGLPGGATLVGSSPELLVARSGGHVVATPYAGSMPRSADADEDDANAKALLASRKDHLEHAVLAEAVVETLRPFCTTIDAPTVPELVSTPTMWHLRTRVVGELRDRESTALRLAAALHPTPAICGTPTDTARKLVTELEPFDRGYYAGTVGWVDTAGDGEWAVSIRCAEVAGASRALRLYAGGGIVADSDPRAELDETSAKFATLLRALGLPREWLEGNEPG